MSEIEKSVENAILNYEKQATLLAKSTIALYKLLCPMCIKWSDFGSNGLGGGGIPRNIQAICKSCNYNFFFINEGF